MQDWNANGEFPHFTQAVYWEAVSKIHAVLFKQMTHSLDSVEYGRNIEYDVQTVNRSPSSR